MFKKVPGVVNQMWKYIMQSLWPEESCVSSETFLQKKKKTKNKKQNTEFHHQHQKSWVQILSQWYGIFYLYCSSVIKTFWHFNSWETQLMIQSQSLNVI